MKNIKFILSISCLIILLISCASQAQISEAELEDGIWTLTSLDGDSPVDGTKLTLVFNSGQISGNAGCNHYTGSYQIQNDSFRIEDLSYTEMACLDVVGTMDQERIYLDLLSSSNRLELDGEKLTFFNDLQAILVYVNQEVSPAGTMGTIEQPLPSVTNLPEVTQSPVVEAPTGFVEYQDVVTNVSIYIPGNWAVTGIDEGRSAFFQSYPLDKYVGGEPLQAGDAKCDLGIQPVDTLTAELIQQWRNDPMTTIVSEDDFQFLSGRSGTRFVIENMGRAIVYVTEINARVILLTCFGDFSQVNQIAETINAIE